MKLLARLGLGAGAVALSATGVAYGTGLFAYALGHDLEPGSSLEAELRHSFKTSGAGASVYGIDCPDFSAGEPTVECAFHRGDGTPRGLRVYFEDDGFVYEEIDPKVERQAVDKQLAEVKRKT